MKVVVIGAGLAGIQTAWFLSRQGAEVIVVERREGPALETSFANGGLVTPSHAAPWNSPGILGVLLGSIGRKGSPILVRPSALPGYLGWGFRFVRNSTPSRFRRTVKRNAALAAYSMEQFTRICDEVKPAFDGAALGTMMIYRNEASFEAAKARITLVAEAGVAADLLSSAQMVSREPALAEVADRLAGGVHYPGDRHGDAHKYTVALAGRLKATGVTFRFGENVTGFERRGNALAAVLTDRGRIEADAVVLAAARWSRELAASQGLNLPIKPVKGYSVTYEAEGWNGAPKIPVIDDDRHIAVTPLGSRVRFVGSAEFAGTDPAIDPARIENLRRAAFDMYPALEGIVAAQTPLCEWAGFRPMTPDCLPILGRCGPDNLYVNTGHGYLGWTTAAGTSKAVADMVFGRRPEIAIGDYAYDRF